MTNAQIEECDRIELEEQEAALADARYTEQQRQNELWDAGSEARYEDEKRRRNEAETETLGMEYHGFTTYEDEGPIYGGRVLISRAPCGCDACDDDAQPGHSACLPSPQSMIDDPRFERVFTPSGWHWVSEELAGESKNEVAS